MTHERGTERMLDEAIHLYAALLIQIHSDHEGRWRDCLTCGRAWRQFHKRLAKVSKEASCGSK